MDTGKDGVSDGEVFEKIKDKRQKTKEKEQRPEEEARNCRQVLKDYFVPTAAGLAMTVAGNIMKSNKVQIWITM
jgi:hypothetical protein